MEDKENTFFEEGQTITKRLGYLIHGIHNVAEAARVLRSPLYEEYSFWEAELRELQEDVGDLVSREQSRGLKESRNRLGRALKNLIQVATLRAEIKEAPQPPLEKDEVLVSYGEGEDHSQSS